MQIVREAFKDAISGVIHVKLCYFDPNLGSWEPPCGQSEADMAKLRRIAVLDFPELTPARIKYELAGISNHPEAIGIAFDLEPGTSDPIDYCVTTTFK